MTISQEDRAAIHDLLSMYCWTVDEGDGDGWASIFTRDGKILQSVDESAQMNGEEELRRLPPVAYEMFKGRLRHELYNIVIAPGATPDSVVAKAYGITTNWMDAKPGAMSKEYFTLVRQNGAWKIKLMKAETLFWREMKP